MAALQKTRGPRVTRRLTDPNLRAPQRAALEAARALAELHNAAVKAYGSNSGGRHMFNPEQKITVGVVDDGPFERGTVVTPLSWGVISVDEAQRVLEEDGVA